MVTEIFASRIGCFGGGTPVKGLAVSRLLRRVRCETHGVHSLYMWLGSGIFQSCVFHGHKFRVYQSLIESVAFMNGEDEHILCQLVLVNSRGALTPAICHCAEGRACTGWTGSSRKGLVPLLAGNQMDEERSY